MGEIIITEKPDWISFEDIHELLYAAHESNRAKGFNVKTAVMSGEEIKAHLGDTGKCFVALDGERLAGTVSYRICKRNFWCAKGDVVDRVLAGVHPDYKGRHLSTMLFDKIVEEAKTIGCFYIESRTAEENDIVQKINLKDGYRYVDYLATKADHYTVVMLSWLNGCPYPKWRTQLHFLLKKYYVRLRFKPGRIRRFW